MSKEDHPIDAPRKARWRSALRLLGPILFVWFLTTVDLAEVLRVLRLVPVTHVAAAAALCFVLVFVKALRWHLLLSELGVRETYGMSLVTYGDGLFWGTLTPGRLGEFKKLVHLHDRHGVSWLRGAWFNAMDRGFDVLAIVVLFCVSVFLLPPWIRAAFRPALLAGVLSAAALAVMFRRIWAPMLQRWGARGRTRFHRMIETGALDVLSVSTGRLLLLIILSLAGLLLYVAMIRVLSSRLPFELTVSQVTVCVVTSMLAGIVPISYFNLGSRELVLVTLFGSFELSRDLAMGFSMLFLACYVILMAVTAIFWRMAIARRRRSAETAASRPNGLEESARCNDSTRAEDVLIA